MDTLTVSKIGLIKILRVLNPDISLKEAKEYADQAMEWGEAYDVADDGVIAGAILLATQNLIGALNKAEHGERYFARIALIIAFPLEGNPQQWGFFCCLA